MEKKFILIGHKKRHGKDTFAKFLSEELKNSEIVSFATPLKMIVADALGVTYDEQEYSKNNGRIKAFLKFRRLVFLTTDFRTLLQRFGSGKMKYHFGKAVWRDALLRSVENSDARYIIVPDFRFPEEIIEEASTIKVFRPGMPSTDNHISETALDDYIFCHNIANDKDISYLKKQAKDFAEYIDYAINTEDYQC